MVRSSRSGENHVEIQQTAVKPCAQRFDVSKGRNPADGKTGFSPGKGCISPPQRLARKGLSRFNIDLMASGCQKKIGAAAGLTSKDHRLGNLIDMDIQTVGSLLGRAGLANIANVNGQAELFQGGDHTGFALAHMETLARCSERFKPR